MHALSDFGRTILLVSGGLTIAIGARVLAHRVAVPTAALLLVAAAVLSDAVTSLQTVLTFADVQRIATVALVVILFDGGMSIGGGRFRAAATRIVLLGVPGTFATAALVAVAARVLLGFSWIESGLIGAAIAPTDPAVTFSVLSGRETHGRARTVLEGESGFNDPVGIALMVGLVDFATREHASFWTVVWEFLREIGIGLGVGVAGGVVLLELVRRVPLPDASLYPIATLLAAGVLYGAAAIAGGSGFLAVFLAGIVLGDAAFPKRRAVMRFHAALSTLGELAVFVALGLTVDVGSILRHDLWWQGLVLATLLAVVVRPAVVVPLLLGSGLDRAERSLVTWSGLKGAVPILLASLPVVAGAPRSVEIYGIVFVVVLCSVAVQGVVVGRLGGGPGQAS